MDLTYSIDHVARTSDEAAVKARFDARTLMWLRVLSIFALIVTFPHLIAAAGEGTPRPIIAAAVGFGTAAVVLWSVRRKSAKYRLAEWVRYRVRGVAIAFALIEAASLVSFHARSEGAVAMAVLVSLAVLGYRLLPAEHILLHSALAAISIVSGITNPMLRHGMAEELVPPVMANAMVLMLSLFISRRARRQIVADWTERRASAREQIRMRDELRYARELQLSMLPEHAPVLAWADLSAVSIPATEVGGDYYDYFVDGDRVALVCGDVAGHGMAAGLVLSALRTGFTLMRDSLHDPAAVLRRLHDLVAQTSRRRMLVTVSVVLLDRRTMQATIASAGHPPVILRRADRSVETIDLYAPPLGVRLPVNIPQRRIDVQPGDVFVLHSDGIYETRNDADVVYGLERLEAVIHEHGHESAESLRDAILAHVERFRGNAEQGDDVTVVVAKIVER